MNNHVSLAAEKAMKSILNGYKLAVANGNIETYQDESQTQAMKDIVEKLCIAESDLKDGRNFIDTLASGSIQDVDKEFKAYEEAHAARADPKESQRYQNFVKEIEDIQYANTRTETTQELNETQTVGDVELTVEECASQFKLIDPITKQPIKDPVRNIHCSHVYEKKSIIEAMQVNKQKRCPYVGCANKQPLRGNDLQEDRELKRKILKEESKSQMGSDDD